MKRLCLTAQTLALPMVMTLSACASKAPPVTWLSLPLEVSAPAVAASPSTPGASTLPLLVVRRVQIPEYLQSTQVRFRASAQTLAEWPTTRWAERLEVSLTRQLSQQLGALMRPGVVCDSTCPGAASVPSLQVTYQMLDLVRASGQVQAQVNWWWTPAAGNAAAARMGSLTLTEPVPEDSPAGQATAMVRLQAEVARQIAASLPR